MEPPTQPAARGASARERATAARLRVLGSAGASPRSDLARAVREGLGARPKRLSCAFFYDERGSRLFEEICACPEYYLTRAEQEILERHAGDIVRELPPRVDLVELGSGSAAKTRLVIEVLLARQGSLRYVPIDISRAILVESSRALLDEHPRLEVEAIAAEYREGLHELDRIARGPKLVLWLGSNVGNFDRDEAARFLAGVGERLGPSDRCLVGIDLRKDRGRLERAYDDSRGVTARFDLNLLERINRELGGRFDTAAFRHRATYDEVEGRIDMFLVSLRRQSVPIEALGLAVDFEEGEAVHTESSYKYSLAEIDRLAERAQLSVRKRWLDRGERFTLNLLAPV
jgi:L-histidine N-alpha-methyltransferase